jgi:hypothetical protein
MGNIIQGAKNVAKVGLSALGGKYLGEGIGGATSPTHVVKTGVQLLHDKIGTSIPVDVVHTVGQHAHNIAAQAGGTAAAVVAGGLAIGHILSKRQFKK